MLDCVRKLKFRKPRWCNAVNAAASGCSIKCYGRKGYAPRQPTPPTLTEFYEEGAATCPVPPGCVTPSVLSHTVHPIVFQSDVQRMTQERLKLLNPPLRHLSFPNQFSIFQNKTRVANARERGIALPWRGQRCGRYVSQ